ncbi:RNA-binding domain-containing protein [Neolentinus lepideus HHB14362 ss-1]|uniref:RNA-binding domain-containing protein n=1 Tax=Neolentinus lepideus HHB14362 ss-1 TaxID=1314782 RepID=A0A165MT76_9AGAM|nr:RNA-binding domain-containing protein [Neolentinus lepideus HHB14362 ss-1]
MSALGKRKEREEEFPKPQIRGSTLFVSNLPYTATSTDLQTLFSDIAPVRSAFVVTERGSGVSKGVGYVSFAIKEDAKAAFEKLSQEGIALDGRSLRVSWADSKNKHKDEKTDKTVKPRPEPRARPAPSSSETDPLAIRTIVIAGLPASIDSKSLWKKIRKYDGAEKVDWPLKQQDGSEDTTGAHAIFITPAAAQEAVNKLHAHVFKGSLLSVTLKKRLEGLAKATQKRGKTKSGAPAMPSRSSRLIVRNLPFNVTEQDLRAVFLPYGPIYSINIPMSEGEPPRPKGFAFVWMLSKKDAEKAIEGCNGQKVRSGMADGIVSDKQKKKKQRREEEKARNAAKAADGGVEDDEENAGDEDVEEEEDGRKVRERVIAVDWALSKDRWEEEKAKIEEEAEEEEAVSGEDSASGSDEDVPLGVHEHDSGASDATDEDEDGLEEEMDVDAQNPAKPTLPPPETGTTLFIPNVPYEATEDELRTLFRAFGPLRYARITMDPATGRTRGTGFVCFWNKEDADKAIQQSEVLRTETAGDDAMSKKNPFKFSSVLTPDPSSVLAQNLVIHGRTLDVIRAVTRDEATKLKEVGEKARQKADKRNMYLLREGIILPNSPAAENLTTAEVEKRTMSYNARKKLLQSNPSLYISKTRLSIRQVPLFVTERMLRRLATHATRAFNIEFLHGSRPGLTEDELTDPAGREPAHGDDEGSEIEAQPAPKKRPPRKNSKIKQAKIVRQSDRIDPVTGKGRSKGYGFLELDTHANALRVLRWANNNPEVISLFQGWWKAELEEHLKGEKAKSEKEREKGRQEKLEQELEKARSHNIKSRGTLIIEFSIENVQVVQRRAARQKDLKRVAEVEDRLRPREISQSQNAGQGERPSKKPRKDKDDKANSKKKSPQKPSKNSNPVGSIIGKKRKQRKLVKQGHL